MHAMAPSLVLTPDEVEHLNTMLDRLDPGDVALDQPADTLVLSACINALPIRLIAELLRFRQMRFSREAALLIRGLPVCGPLGSTPSDPSQPPQTRAAKLNILLTQAVCSVLGERFAFRSQHGGRLVQQLVPTKADAHQQVGTGSQVFLEWHVEDAFTDLRPDLILLHCLRGDPSATTCVSSIEDLAVPGSIATHLLASAFRVRPDDAHSGLTDEQITTVSVLELLDSRYLLRFDPLYMTADDIAAREALQWLADMLPSVGRAVVLEPGDVLLIDNKRCVHARSPFGPRYDGTDRWLLRCILSTNFRELQRHTDLLRLG